PFVLADHDTIVCDRDRPDHHVERTSWPSGQRALAHEAGPNERGIFLEAQYATGKQRLRALRPREPLLQPLPPLPGRHLQYATTYLGDCQRRNEQVVVGLPRHPRGERLRRDRLRDVADDIGVEEIARHNSTLRPASGERLSSRSTPTSGERRSAA